jgi:hypothetical protein
VCGVLWLLDHTARVAAQEPNFYPPFWAGSPRSVPGGSVYDSYAPVAAPTWGGNSSLPVAPTASSPPAEPQGPPAPMPKGYDPRVNGLWDGRPKPLPASMPAATAPGAAPASYDYARNDDWKSCVNDDGSIRSTPRGAWDPT